MTKTLITAIAVFALAVAVVVGGWGIATVKAQSSTPPPLAPQGLTVANGPNPGTATLSWTAVSGVSSYRIGRLSDDDYQAYADTWRERFAYSDVTATSAFTLTGLIPGEKYYFVVGQNHGGGVAWSSWAELTLNSDRQSCPTATVPTPQPTPTPTLGPTPTPRPTPTGTGDYDADKDGLIEISNLVQLNAIRGDLDGDGVSQAPGYAVAFPNAMPGMGCPNDCIGYELVSDLEFDTNGNGETDAGDAYWNEGSGWIPIGNESRKFDATFDGNQHTIANLYINRRNTDDVGLFGYAAIGSSIEQVGVIQADVSGDVSVSALVGSHEGSITSSYATGNVRYGRWNAGGLVGTNDGTIINSYATVNVSGTFDAGGLVGVNSGTINNSYATGVVSGLYGYIAGGLVGRNHGDGAIAGSFAVGDVSGESRIVGGLVGRNEDNASITGSYAMGDVSGEGDDVGGLVGQNASTITAAYATGNVSGASDNVGGLVGQNEGSITATYATGMVTGRGDDLGGLVGKNGSGSITTSYALGRVLPPAGAFYVGGLVGYNDSSEIANSYWDTETSEQSSSYGGVGKTTLDLQSPASATGIYAEWNPDYWDFGTSSQYPVLKYSGLDVVAQRP